MTALEQQLRDLRHDVAWPDAPDLAASVVAQLAEPPRPRRHRLRLAVVAVAVALAVATAVLAVSPGARSALRDLFRIGGAEITRVDRLPDLDAYGDLVLGDLVPLREAQKRVAFTIRQPETKDGQPVDAVFLDPTVPGGLVTIAWAPEPRLILQQFAGTALPYVRKLAEPGTTIENVEIDGAPGAWLEGAPHYVIIGTMHGQTQEREARLAGNVLIWERDGVTFRLEGDIPKWQALSIARGVR